MPLLAATAGNVTHTTVFTFEQLKQSLYLVLIKDVVMMMEVTTTMGWLKPQLPLKTK